MVKDRVVQAAAVLVLMPVFEADMHGQSYAYRLGRNAHQAMEAIRLGIEAGRFEIIEADLSGYFDTIPHRILMRLVARRISDGRVLKGQRQDPERPRNNLNGWKKRSRNGARSNPR